jgi:predicted lipoprotein with Yx(FWY)xxD motif
MRTSRGAAFAFAAVLVVGASGCGDDGDAGGEPATKDQSTIEVNSTALGDVLTDGGGLTLYLFTKDTATTSSCEGDCLAAWPALEGEPTAGDGADAGLIGTIERGDGTTQATYAGHPGGY